MKGEVEILEAWDLTKKYGEFTAVQGIDFSVAAGEVFGFLGPNGAGKTTTINMLTGLARITRGSVKLAGEKYTRRVKKAREVIGVVPDESNLYEELSGFENLCFCASLYGMRKQTREAKARQLLDMFGLAGNENKPFKAYSKGMKRKLTIAAGIIHEPKILFLDEPTTGIDVASARQIRNLVKQLNNQGTTIFLTTHYIEEAERLCHRIAFIVSGKIVRTGTVRELMEEAQQENIVQFTVAGDTSGLKQVFGQEFPGYTIEISGNNSIRIHSLHPVHLMPLMKFFVEKKNLTVYEAKIIRPSLEEVFVKVTGIEAKKMKQEKESRKK